MSASTTHTRSRGIKPETEEKYRKAIELYGSTKLSCAEISRICGTTVSGLRCHIFRHHRDLMLARHGIACRKEDARYTKLNRLGGQRPDTRAKYKDAIEACGSMAYIRFNVSQIAREFGLDGTNLGRQLRTHYPGTIEWREQIRERLGISDHLPRGMRRHCKKQYAEAVDILRRDHNITIHEVAENCGVSYSGLKQHLLFYHRDLVKRRINICGKGTKRRHV